MKIKLSQNTVSYALGWYGTCDTEEDYDLTQIKQYITSVYQIDADNSTWRVYDPTIALESNDFTKLEVGHAYYLIFSQGTDEVEIPGLKTTNFGDESAGKISESCFDLDDLPDDIFNPPSDDVDGGFDDVPSAPPDSPTNQLSCSDYNEYSTVKFESTIANSPDAEAVSIELENLTITKTNYLEGELCINLSIIPNDGMPTVYAFKLSENPSDQFIISCAGIIDPDVVLYFSKDGKFYESTFQNSHGTPNQFVEIGGSELPDIPNFPDDQGPSDPFENPNENPNEDTTNYVCCNNSDDMFFVSSAPSGSDGYGGKINVVSTSRRGYLCNLNSSKFISSTGVVTEYLIKLINMQNPNIQSDAPYDLRITLTDIKISLNEIIHFYSTDDNFCYEGTLVNETSSDEINDWYGYNAQFKNTPTPTDTFVSDNQPSEPTPTPKIIVDPEPTPTPKIIVDPEPTPTPTDTFVSDNQPSEPTPTPTDGSIDPTPTPTSTATFFDDYGVPKF